MVILCGNTAGTFGWITSATENKGQLYTQGATADVKLVAGGYCALGAHCGSRARGAHYYRWAVSSTLAARLGARAVHK